MAFVEEKTIREMVDRIVQNFNPEKVILFGSYARGNPTIDSDVDLLIVLDDSGKRLELLRAMRRLVRDLPAAKDIIIRTPAEVEKFGKYIGTVLYPALHEGVVMYVRD